MNQLIAVACGGAFGAVLRFLISTGVYQWLGRGFPYGTLAVNIIGSFLIGLMTEALLLQRVSMTMEYRSAILIGLFGSLTTFSTFSLDTLVLIEQGQLIKASLNILISVFVCILAVWVGLTLGRGLFSYSSGTLRWMDWHFPYALVFVSGIGSFLIGFISTLLMAKSSISVEHTSIVVLSLIGFFITFSSIYLILHFIEHGYTFSLHLKSITVALFSNIIVCCFALWIGLLTSKQI